MNREAALDALIGAVKRGDIVLLTGVSGSGKSTICEAAFGRLGARIVRWDPVSTSMIVPKIVDRYMDSDDRVSVVYADDVDIAVHNNKGSGTVLLASMTAHRARGALVMTAGPITGDRVLCAVAKAADLHIHLDEADIRSMMLVGDLGRDEDDADEEITGSCLGPTASPFAVKVAIDVARMDWIGRDTIDGQLGAIAVELERVARAGLVGRLG